MVGRAVYRIVAVGKNRGKTRVGAELAARLTSMGYRVAAVKHAHRGVDLADKDSYRYMEAGAEQVIVSSHWATAVITKTLTDDLASLAALLDPRYFIVLVEGFKESSVGKKIVVAANPGELEELGCSPEDTVAVVSDNDDVLSEAEGKGCRAYRFSQMDELARTVAEDAYAWARSLLPGLDCARCGVANCRMFAHSVLRGERSIGDCPVYADFRLVLDGDVVPLNPYVKNVFMKTIQALIETLKGVKRYPERVEILFKRRSGDEARASSGSSQG